MNRFMKNILTALMCFCVVLVLNFLLPRLLPGNPVAYLTGVDEENLTSVQYEYYEEKLHLNEPLYVQFAYYIQSILNGTLGYSYKKEAVVSQLISERLGNTLQITLPAVILSTLAGLLLGLHNGYRRGSVSDRVVTTMLLVLNAVPAFLLALVLIIFCCFQNRWFPYSGLNSPFIARGGIAYFADRVYHLILPVLTLTLAAAPSRYLLMRNTAAAASQEKYILYAKARGLPDWKIQTGYVLKNIAQPFITLVGMSVSTCVGGSLVIENIFSINGMGTLLTDAVYTLDYPLLQGILFVITLIMVISILVSDVVCILIDPRVRFHSQKEGL